MTYSEKGTLTKKEWIILGSLLQKAHKRSKSLFDLKSVKEGGKI